jgi:dipeptidyl-peptidase-4
MKEFQVTTDGRFNFVINGTTDWVYEEEFEFVKGFFWSPDSKKIAYYRFDESEVREYNMQVWGNGLYPKDYRFKYPKAGETISKVEIWFYDIASRKKAKADLGDNSDSYIPRAAWTNDPDLLSVRKLSRLQNRLELFHVSASTGRSMVVLEEKSDTYVDVTVVDNLVYLKDNKHFIISNESSGFSHLYLYTMEGTLVRAITKGAFEVSTLIGVDERTRTLYYTSTETSPLERQFYAISFKGDRKKRLSSAAGVHTIELSPDFKFYIDQYSSSVLAPQADLYDAKTNRKIKTLENNKQLMDLTNNIGLADKEFFKFRSAGEDSLYGYMMKPGNFVAGKKYPVLIYQYSGPGSQNVNNSWAGNHYFFHQLLTQHGYIVAVIDTRGTGARGEKFKKATYRQLGKLELDDLLKTGNYLSSLPFVDPQRLGVWGWSYGAYVTALAMTKGAGAFKIGIAVSPVTNWRFYDTVYTERYLQTPQLNPAGYDDYSPLTHADELQGHFLLIHGTGDDNVHVQNSLLFQQALVHAGKQFSSFYYIDKHHHIPGPKTRQHLYSMMLKFVQDHL